MDTLLETIETIIGTPTNDYQELALYVVACFMFIFIVKLVYSLFMYILGFKR